MNRAEPDHDAGSQPAPLSPFRHRATTSARVERARSLASRPDGLPSLNRLTELAAQLLGAESAQVSVIADDQRVMGGSGLAVSTVGARSPASESLCLLPLAQGAPVAIPDTRADDRVRTLPPVVGGAAAAYLGVPLRSGGHVVGSLCVVDSTPRTWSGADVRLLEQLAEPALAELELAALESTYEEDRAVWQLAVDAAGVGAFDWDLASGLLRWDERLLELFGHDRSSFGGTIEAFDDLVHPDDRERVGVALDRAIATCGEYAAEYRIVRPDGSLRWIAARGHAVAGPDGAAVRVLGAAYDTTTVREGEARVARTLEVMPTAFFHLDHDWRFTYANPEAERLLGGIGTDVVGHVVWELFPDAVGSDFERFYRGSVATGRPQSFEAYYPPPLDAWFEVRCWPTPDGLSVYFIEVTERRVAQDVLARAAGRAELLADVTRTLTDTLEADEAVERLAQILVPRLGDWCVITQIEGRLPDGPLSGTPWRRRLRDVGWWHADEARRPLVEEYAAVRVPALTDGSLVADALASREPVVVASGATERIVAILEPGRAADLCRELAPAAAVVVPLPGRGRTAGLLTVFRDAGRPSFTPEDLVMLTEVADRAGLALDNASLYAGQRDLAERLQRSLLTAPPTVAGLDVAVRYEPAAESAQVGGDWYDAFQQPRGDTLTLVIGDVIGHDATAAAAMGQVRTLLRGIAVTTGAGPAEVLHGVDLALTTLRVDTMATALVGRLERTEGPGEPRGARLRWSNAGHPPPLVVTDGRARTLWSTATDPLLGLLPDLAASSARRETVADLPPGSLLLLYTDGLVERRGEVLDVGIERLCAVVTELIAEDPATDDLCDRLLRRMLPGWTEDDVALVAVRLRD
ncbi:MAG TPA: SpoIIE family protein phosphatase [Nocardioides sp.]